MIIITLYNWWLLLLFLQLKIIDYYYFYNNNFKGPGHSHWFDWGHTWRGASKPRRLWKKGNH